MSLLFRRLQSTFRAERPQDIRKIASPLGLAKPPRVEVEQKPRTWSEIKKDWTDLDKNRQRREELKSEFFKSSFENIYNFRHTGGRIFSAPKFMFTPESSLYMPNIRGNRLDDGSNLNTSLLALLSKTSPNVVRIFSSQAGRAQLDGFVDGVDFAALQTNRVDVNVPTSWINRLLVRAFSGKIQRAGSDVKYLLADEKLNTETRQALCAPNDLAGYLYVVDKNHKIRWAAAGAPIEDEKKRLVSYLKEL